MNINKGYKKGVALGCTHGSFIHQKDAHAVADFADRSGCDTRVHLGDYIDATALRGGAGAKDMAVKLSEDMDATLAYLNYFQPPHLINGNHDIRLWELLEHPNTILATAAKLMIEKLERGLVLTPTFWKKEYSVWDHKQLKFGDCTFMHGFMYGARAIQEHAQHYGKVVHAHIHRTGIEHAVNAGERVTGYSVGTLADVEQLRYAERRKQSMIWGPGCAYFEYNQRECIVHLIEKQGGKWPFPA